MDEFLPKNLQIHIGISVLDDFESGGEIDRVSYGIRDWLKSLWSTSHK